MVDQEQRYRDYPQGLITPAIQDTEEFFSKSLELTEWFTSGLSTTGSFDVGIMVVSPFGKLLDALPLPVIMIDSSYKVAFANQACSTISNSYKMIQGVPFASLVPRSRNSEKALAVVKRVLLARKSVVAEGILEIDARKVWGRLYFRPIRIATERYVLLVVADLTSEKTRLLLKQKADERKDFLISATNEKLSEQFRHRERIEQALKSEKERFEKLTELLKLPIAVLAANRGFRYVSPDFKELFGRIFDKFPLQQKSSTASGPARDPYAAEILNWFEELGNSKEASPADRTFALKHKDGSEKRVACRAVRLDDCEYLVLCEDVTGNGHPPGSRFTSPTL